MQPHLLLDRVEKVCFVSGNPDRIPRIANELVNSKEIANNRQAAQEVKQSDEDSKAKSGPNHPSHSGQKAFKDNFSFTGFGINPHGGLDRIRTCDLSHVKRTL